MKYGNTYSAGIKNFFSLIKWQRDFFAKPKSVKIKGNVTLSLS